jgi:hypothetical protein
VLGPYASVEALKGPDSLNLEGSAACPRVGGDVVAVATPIETDSASGETFESVLSLPSAAGFYDLVTVSIAMSGPATTVTTSGSVIRIRR